MPFVLSSFVKLLCFSFCSYYTLFASSSLQHELLRVLYPLFFHCVMDLVAKGHIQEGMKYFYTLTFNNNFINIIIFIRF